MIDRGVLLDDAQNDALIRFREILIADLEFSPRQIAEIEDAAQQAGLLSHTQSVEATQSPDSEDIAGL